MVRWFAVSLLKAIAGGIFYRLRGGPLKDWFPKIFGTQLSRLVAWAIPTAILIYFTVGMPIWMLVVLVLSHWLSMVSVGTGQYLNPIDYDEMKELRPYDFLGIARTVVAAAPLFFVSKTFFIVYALSGNFHAAMYWLGHKTKYAARAGEFFVGFYTWMVISILGAIVHA